MTEHKSPGPSLAPSHHACVQAPDDASCTVLAGLRSNLRQTSPSGLGGRDMLPHRHYFPRTSGLVPLSVDANESVCSLEVGPKVKFAGRKAPRCASTMVTLTWAIKSSIPV